MTFILGTAAPGVHAEVNNAQIARAAQLEGSDALFVAGYSIWGPANSAVNITGLGEYTRRFGGFHPNSHLTDAIHLFFREGGTRAVVCRVVGAATAVATLTVNDRAGVPLATLRVDAKYPSSTVRVYVTIEAGDEANTVKITARTPDLALPTEIFNNLKLTFTQPELDAINNNLSKLITVQKINELSNLIKLTNLASATAAPANLPALTAETLLAGGSDDFAGLTDASFIGTDDGITRTGLQVFNTEEHGTGQVALPGITTTAAHLALAAHASAFKRFAIADLAPGADADDAITERRLLDSSYLALYWPPTIQAYDLTGSGVKKQYPVSGAVAGVFARAEREIGVHKAPANYQLLSALDVERASNGSPQTSEATRALLNRNEINVITPLSEEGVKVYGARVCASYGRVTAIHEQRVLNQAYYQLKKSYRSLVFGVLGGDRIFREARSVSEQYLRLLFRSGALFRTQEYPEGFVVICDANNNPREALDQHQLHVDVGLYIVGMAEMILLSINNVPLSTSLDVLRG
jgi:hypothetical protein